MGMSVESYRLNIGIFNNRPLRKQKYSSQNNTQYNFIFSKNFKIYLLFTIFLTITQYNNFALTIQNNNNKLSHISNGNTKLANIKTTHFNKGNSLFALKMLRVS